MSGKNAAVVAAVLFSVVFALSAAAKPSTTTVNTTTTLSTTVSTTASTSVSTSVSTTAQTTSVPTTTIPINTTSTTTAPTTTTIPSNTVSTTTLPTTSTTTVPQYLNATFTETGLPSGAVWGVRLNTTTAYAVAPASIIFQRQAGSYAFAALNSTTSGVLYVSSPGYGSILAGSSQVISYSALGSSTTIPQNSISTTTSTTVPTTTVPQGNQIYGPYAAGQELPFASYASIYNFSYSGKEAWLKVNNQVVGPYVIGQQTALGGVSIYNVSTAGVWVEVAAQYATTTSTATTTILPASWPGLETCLAPPTVLYVGRNITCGAVSVALRSLYQNGGVYWANISVSADGVPLEPTVYAVKPGSGAAYPCCSTSVSSASIQAHVYNTTQQWAQVGMDVYVTLSNGTTEPSPTTTVTTTTIPQSYNASSGTLYTGQSFASGPFNITLTAVGYPNSAGISSAIIDVYQGRVLMKQLFMIPNAAQTVNGTNATVQIDVGQIFQNYYSSKSWAQVWALVKYNAVTTVSSTTIPQNFTAGGFNTTAVQNSGYVHISQSISHGLFSLILTGALAPDLVNTGNSTASFAVYYNGVYIGRIYVARDSASTVTVSGQALSVSVGTIHPGTNLTQNWAYVSLAGGNSSATAPTSSNTATIAAHNATAVNIIIGNATGASQAQSTTTVQPTATTGSAPSAAIPKRVVVSSTVQRYNTSSQGPLSSIANLFTGGPAASAQRAQNATTAITGAVDSAASSYAMAVIKTNATANGGSLAAAQLYIGLYGSIISSFFGTGSRPSNPGTSNNTANANTDKTR